MVPTVTMSKGWCCQNKHTEDADAQRTTPGYDGTVGEPVQKARNTEREVNTGQLGPQSRLRLLDIVSNATDKRLFPANPNIVDALPGCDDLTTLVDENVTPVACKQQ